MRSVLLVDWLGRGGIAQTTESWVIELRRAGASVHVVSRRDRELLESVGGTGPAESRSSLLSHARLCRLAAREISERQPDVVVLQNYVVPLFEEVVHSAARRAGSELIFVVHDHRHHEWREGGHLGLGRQIGKADRVIAHSAAVRESLGAPRVQVVPLPVQVGLVDLPGSSVVGTPSGQLVALQFGILNRSYKGTQAVVQLASAGVPGWAFAFAGVGAPPCPAAQSVSRFLTAGELVATVRLADAVLLPYTHASQSGAVVLAQALGTAVIATGVDGVGEQIIDRETGLLVSSADDLEGWRSALALLQDHDLRHRIQEQARAAAWNQHAAFREAVLGVTGVADH